MELTLTELKEQRLQKLFSDCQQQVIAQIIGPFGLSSAMFEDRNGGNVTTVHNFENASADYVAEKDQKTYTASRERYDRSELKDIKQSVKDKLKAPGVDGYTGKQVDPAHLEADHVTALKKIYGDRKNHLAYNTGEGLDRLSDVANNTENLVATHRDVNNPKRAKDILEFADEVIDGKTQAERLELDSELMRSAKERSEDFLERTAKRAIRVKQTSELLKTGANQAAQMGLRQALGVLLNELVNGLFNEIKTLIKHGVEQGKTLFEEIRQRLAGVAERVLKKLPDAVSQMFQGGISGFMSNLLTFVLNEFLSTAKRFVTVIREGLVGLFKAFKMILFPPANLTPDQALQEGLKLLSAVVVSSVGLLLQETVKTFISSLAFLLPVADILSSALIGTLSGLLSAFLAYQIDCMFDRYRHGYDEQFMDELIADSRRREEFAQGLVELSESSLRNVSAYNQSIILYQGIGQTLAASGRMADATLASLEHTVSQTREQVAKSVAMIEYIESSQRDIEDFLETL
ncbi:hypothetical protein [Pseudomonas helvetica]|uniref:hypothetical protein n=1 Tax=Pseudomonas helvetica TaxID=3136738 RepID=UPI0032672E85